MEAINLSLTELGFRMSIDSKKVLVVDDEPIINDLLAEYLKGKYEVNTATRGQEAIDFCRTNSPNVVILDVNLGDMDGREVCRQIKDSGSSNSPAVIFISADSDEETILGCFESGGDDYLVKPFSPSLVLQKVDSIFKYSALFTSLKSESEELSELVTSTMSQASSYGALLNLVKKLNYCNSESEIADCVFNYLNNEAINSAIFFKTSNHEYCFDSQARVCSPILKEVFELTHNRQRLYRTKTRVIASDKHVSILFKNPPPEDSEEWGIFIDVIAVLIEALEARYLSYLREKELGVLHNELSGVINELNVSMEDVRGKKQKLIDDIVLRIGLSFHQLDMTEEQEDFFNKMLEDTVMGHDDTNIAVSELQSKLSELVSQINELVMPAQRMQQIEDDDVELF